MYEGKTHKIKRIFYIKNKFYAILCASITKREGNYSTSMYIIYQMHSVCCKYEHFYAVRHYMFDFI